VLPELCPPVKVSSRGQLEVDWSGYDRVAAPLLSGDAFANRVGLAVWLFPLQAVASATDEAALHAPGSQQLAKQYVADAARHLEERGWLARSIALVNDFSRPTPESLSAENRLSELIRSARPDIRIASRRIPQDMEPYGWIGFPSPAGGGVDVAIVDGQYYHPASLTARAGGGSEGWLAVDRPPFSGSISIHARAGDTLALSWQADRLGASRLWLGPINHWPTEGLPTDPANVANASPKALLYPGTAFGLNRPLPTLRLKRVRETIQQAAYARLLEQHGQGAVVQSLRNALVTHAGTGTYRAHFADGRPPGWPEKPEAYEHARRIMAQQMAGSGTQAGVAGRGPELIWRSFLAQRRTVRLTVDGTRLRLTGTHTQPRIQVETWFTVTNASPDPVQGFVTLLGVPPECEPGEKESVGGVAAGRSQRGSVRMTCDANWLLSGNRNLSLQFTGPGGTVFEQAIPVSLLIAEPTPRPLVMDGDLSDWVAASGNVASDFRLIAGGCGESDRADCDRPSMPTLVYTRRDDEHLYLAVNARADDASAPVVRRSSVVYDDLVPMDVEDLIEILIDPLNGGTRSPADLYRVVVKRSGVYFLERGLSCDPPVGPRSGWPADAIVASRTGDGGWTAEIRIPLVAFGRPEAVRGEIWGLNVTHYQAARQEFSTWSRAVGNAYDPLSLGNLLLP
jgi:hypothetical protein